MQRLSVFASVGLVLLAAAAGWWFGQDTPGPEPIPVMTLPAAPGREALTVYVAGAVRSPGLVEVPDGARVADAIAAAGGALPTATLAGVNLAAPLADGMQVTVPDEAVEQVAAGGDAKVRVNQASVSDLEQLPGVGPVLAARIAAYRDEHGPFATVEDLLDVPGIGEGKLDAMRDAVQVP